MIPFCKTMSENKVWAYLKWSVYLSVLTAASLTKMLTEV